METNGLEEKKAPNGAVGDVASEMTDCDSEPASVLKTELHSNDNIMLPAFPECVDNGHSTENIGDMLAVLKTENDALKYKIDELQKENSRLEADKSPELYQIQLETLEKVILNQKTELQKLDISKNERIESLLKQIQHLKSSYEDRIEKINKQFAVVNKEKESMVMKYAISEKYVLDYKVQCQNNESKMKELNKDKELLQNKIKSILNEKQRIHQLLDNKTLEANNLYKEIDGMKQQLDAKDIKIKWLQNNFQTELERNKETQTKLDKMQLKLNEAKEETEQIRKDGQALLRSYHESQDTKEEEKIMEDNEQKVKIIVENYEAEQMKVIEQEYEVLKKKHQTLVDENHQLQSKIQSLEKEKTDCEQMISKLKQSAAAQQQVVNILQLQLSDFEATKRLLNHEQERLVSSQTEVERFKLTISDMQGEMTACRDKEAELLEYTQRLTDKNINLQSEFTAVDTKAKLLESQVEPVKKRLEELEVSNHSLSSELEKEKTLRAEENQLLARHLAERTQKTEQLEQQLQDQVGENQLLKKKHAVSLKELTRELQHCRKKMESCETSSSANSICLDSRTSSNSSLNTCEINENKQSSQQSPSNSLEPDRALLIDKIVKLQRSNAKKAEKLEFKEDHARQLMSELKKKEKIIRHYALREHVGALAPGNMDENKAQLTKHGGIMASVYTSKPVDESMTLDLSLDISSRLQAVLEDTLLKNIMLKDNMETLGNEIARLNRELQRLKS